MKKYYPLLRREAIRLVGPMALLLIALIAYMGNFGQDIGIEARTVAKYGLYHSSIHPSNMLRPEYAVFAAGFGMVLSLAQHFMERSSPSTLYWELLPYSRWEKMYIKSISALLPAAIFCVIGHNWTGWIISANADWIAQINAQMPGLSYLEDLLRADRIMAHWAFLFAGVFAGYSLITFLCQIFASWWRSALLGGAVFLLTENIAGWHNMCGNIHWETVIDGRTIWLQVQDARLLLPEICVLLAAGAGLLVGAFLLERTRSFERTGYALYRPQLQGYICGAIAVLGLLSTGLNHNTQPFLTLIGIALLIVLTVFDVPKLLRFRK